MKKILSLILAGLMTVSCAAFVAADEAETAAETATLEDYAIEFLWNQKIFKGTGTAEELVADADANIERYQMALFVARMSTGWVDDDQWEDDVANDSTFKDIDSDPVNKYLGAISYANQNGIIEGYNADEFGPYDSITYRDALAMVVRTLGYKGLSYPWGYIEKAVELGLTKGVEVPYTQELTRGQVAIIIYHAMFAATKDGDTLAKSIFDVDFAWENIVIVAADRASFESNGLTAPSGYVAFKILQDNVDASLKNEVYYVKASELGLDGHTDDVAVGDTYLVLVKSVDSKNIVSLVNYYDLCVNTIYNDGKYVNAAAIDLPITAELSKYALVNKFQTADYISATDKPEMMLYVKGDFNVKATDDTLIGIDWDTLNIMVRDNPADTTWDIAWYYNAELQKYYKLDYNADADNVYVNWMTEADFAAFYADAIEYVKSTDLEYVRNAGATTNAPYAELKLFDLDEDGLAERAQYKHYNIGYFSKATTACSSCGNAQKTSYVITSLNGSTVLNVLSEEHAVHATMKGQAWLNVSAAAAETFTGAETSLVIYNYDKTTGEFEILKHITGAKADETDDDYIATGVLKGYSVDRNQIVLDGTFLPLGYTEMKAYGVDLYHGDWDNGGKVAAKVAAANALDAALLQYVTVAVLDGKVVDIDINNVKKDNVIICLGYAGITADNYIAVYGYSTETISDEGYGVANKYDVDIFKIASYNGWKRGDYNYYPVNAFHDAAFVPGSIYKITSYDAETDSYNVYTENIDSAKANAIPVWYGFEDGYRLNLTAENKGTVDAKMSANDQYVIVLSNGTVFVYRGIVKAEWWQVKGLGTKIGSNIVIYVDDIDDHYILGFNETAHEVGLVLYDSKVTSAANWEAWYDEALATSGDAFLEAGNYLLGSTQTKARVFDLLTGEKEYAVVANNIDLVNGRVYITIGNTIIGEMGAVNIPHDHNTCEFIEVAKHMYWDIDDWNWYNDDNYTEAWDWWRDNYQDAEFMVYDGEYFVVETEETYEDVWVPAMITGAQLADANTAKRIFADWLRLVDFDEFYDAGTSVELAKGFFNTIKTYMYSRSTGLCTDIFTEALDPAKTYIVAIIYDVDTKNVVVYIYDEMTSFVKTVDADAAIDVDAWPYDNDNRTVESTLKLAVDATYTGRVFENNSTLGGGLNHAAGSYVDQWDNTLGIDDVNTTIKGLSLWFDNLYVANGDHGDIAVNGYLFGIDDFHGTSYFGYEDTKIEITKGGKTTELDATELNYDVYPCDCCGIVYGINVANLGITMGRNETVVVRFEIDGQTTFQIPGATTDKLGGNNIEVELTITTDEDAVASYEITDYVVNKVSGYTPVEYNADGTIKASTRAALQYVSLKFHEDWATLED